MKFIENLDKETIKSLNELMRKSPSFKIRKRAHAILLSYKRFKIDQLASIFDVDRDTISQWLKRWDEKGLNGLKDAARSGRPPKRRVPKKSDYKREQINNAINEQKL